MFPIKIHSEKDVNGKFIHTIRYELTPDLTKGLNKIIVHQSQFSNLVKAKIVSHQLSQFLIDSYYFLDLIYTKLSQLEISLNQSEKYLKIDFNKIQEYRIKCVSDSQTQHFAYYHINNIKDFLAGLKYWCFMISKNYYHVYNRLFKLLLYFEEMFIKTYRSSQILSADNKLKFFL